MASSGTVRMKSSIVSMQKWKVLDVWNVVSLAQLSPHLVFKGYLTLDCVDKGYILTAEVSLMFLLDLKWSKLIISF